MPETHNPTEVMKGEVRFTIPAVLLEVFAKQPRIVIKMNPAGYWPIDPGILLKNEALLQKLTQDKEFSQNYELVLMPKG